METPKDIMDFVGCTGKQHKFRKQPGYYFRETGMVDHLVLLRGNLN